MTSPVVLLKALALLLALVFIPLSALLLLSAVTWTGFLLGTSVFLIAVGPLLHWIGDERDSLLQIRVAKALLAFGLVLALFLFLQAPEGRTEASARMHVRFADGSWRFDRFALANVLPEIDQIHLGFLAARAFDPMMTARQLDDLADMCGAFYAEMEQEPDFHACGSALPAIYKELTLAEFRDGHYFHYIPPTLDRAKPSPALVFLHGSGGNFKVYAWLLSKVADQVGCSVIAPTFGFGNWERRGAYEAITAAIADAGKHAAIDPDHIHLMGLSNGGKGVCLAESEPGPSFRSLIFLSGLMHERVTPETLAARRKDRPVFVLSGGSDDRVPWDYVAGYAERFEKAGMRVSVRRFEGEDHFLFFRRHEEVLTEIVAWLEMQQ